MANKKLRVGIVGCGKIAHVHAKALDQISECSLVAAQSRNPERAKNFAATFNLSAYTNVQDMVLEAKLDAVIVCTPHPEHKNPAIAALTAGAHVLVEKPLAVTLSDCDAMIHAASKYNKKLGVISQRRFSPSSQRMKKAIMDGKIGAPSLATVIMLGWRSEAYYKSDPWRGTLEKEGGGVLVNQAPHQLDLLQWFMNDEISELYGVCNNINHPYIEVEDTGVMNVRWRNGAMGSMSVTMLTYPKNLEGSITILGEKGTVRVGGVAVNDIQHWEFAESMEYDAQIKDANYQTASVYGFGHP